MSRSQTVPEYPAGCSERPTVFTRPPQRAKTRCSPAQGRSERRGESYSGPYAEPLSDARTPLADFFRIMLKEGGAPSAEAGGSIAFEVQDVDQMVEQLRAKGVRVKLEPLSTPVCRLAVILDSEGNAVTLHQVTQTW